MTCVLGVVDAVDGWTIDGSPWKSGASQRRFAGRAMWEWTTRRVSDASRVDMIAVLTKPDAIDDLRAPADVHVLATTEPSPLGRLRVAVQALAATAVVRVAWGRPFVDPALIDRLIDAAEKTPCDYAGFVSRRGTGRVETQVGVVADWFSAKALARKELDPLARERGADLARWFVERPGVFESLLLPLPIEIDRDDVRLELGAEADWDHVREIYEALGPERLDCTTIAGLLDRQPEMRRRMADLNRRQSNVRQRVDA